MPDFLVIGGQRAGTTWLHHVLSANESVWLPPCKELHHFDAVSRSVPCRPYRYREHLLSRARHCGLAAARGLTRRRLRPDVALRIEPVWDARYFLKPGRSIAWYRSLFETPAARGRVTGEITPAYSVLPAEEVQAIAEAFPDLRILLILRDPVARAFSHALKDLAPGAARDPERLTAFLRSPGCFERSNWPAILDRWEAAFSGAVLALDFERIRTEPAAFLADVAAHIGAPLRLPSGAGATGRERGGSSHRADGLPSGVRHAVADLYGPVVARTAARHPEIAAGWPADG